MADEEEDGPKAFLQPADELDLSDETQDFRFLAGIGTSAEQPSLPRRGEKDFEPHGTSSQQNVLAESRAAMHDALSYPRVHLPKDHITGTFDPDTGRIAVHGQKGQHFRTMGKADSLGRLHLLPEEALYLVERGNLDLRWPDDDDGESFGGLPFSLQSAYALLIGHSGLTLERYTVFAGLKRSGYIVNRTSFWDPGSENADEVTGQSLVAGLSLSQPFYWLYNAIFMRNESPMPLGPLVRPGLYRNYGDMFRRLSIIPFHDPELPFKVKPAAARKTSEVNHETEGELESHASKLRCCFHVWKPRPGFRKSAPGEPDFRIAVIDARANAMPSLEQLDGLLGSVPYMPPPPSMNTQSYQKLKHGWRNVILGIVDTGVVSYLRLSDAGFGKEKLYDRGSRARGNKGRGGTGVGAGRGRGRGRGR